MLNSNDNIRIVHAIEEASSVECKQWPSFHFGGSRLTMRAASIHDLVNAESAMLSGNDAAGRASQEA